MVASWHPLLWSAKCCRHARPRRPHYLEGIEAPTVPCRSADDVLPVVGADWGSDQTRMLQILAAAKYAESGKQAQPTNPPRRFLTATPAKELAIGHEVP